MARVLQSLRRVLGLTPPRPSQTFARSIDTDFSRFREGDRVILHGKTPILTKPLQKNHKTDLPRGYLPHESIIGQKARSRVQAHKGTDYRVTHPTFEEYVSLTPRLVTPIYGPDAELIVSLLDIHVAPPAEGDDLPPLEILESGTGHGSLTLHLSRAIQAANPCPPAIPLTSQIKYLQGRPQRPDEQKDQKDEQSQNSDTPNTAEKETTTPSSDPVQEQWDAWRSQRRAVIHTVDVSPSFSARAEKTVRGFRRGLYAGNVDFYVGHAENWIAEQIRQRTPKTLLQLTKPTVEPFLTHAILDMPSAHQRIPHVAPILKPNGILAVFMPSITQIGECVDLIRKQNLPFSLDRVVELGAGISGGRQWDVRFAVKKSRADPSSWTADDADAVAVPTPPREEAPRDDGVLVCRPKVGARIVGGGFVGIWRRFEDTQKR
ncbi:hypothetical protein N8T08_006502 [Aspergillus melleus]|uniref:Uncharacterized protein n=1 Tax=Aspergillus melleus TaxID=138277 RepID=A0ACC3BEN0_9EURO|nr:hypothetical protein N8T08_006502 [Aspergillus melleus]